VRVLCGKCDCQRHGSSSDVHPRTCEPRLDIHPQDAAPRKIVDGGWVRVFNDRDELTLRARVGDLVRPGVVAVPSGWWASLSPGGAGANALTSDGISDLGGGGDFHDTQVDVERCDMGHERGEWC
jgi:anaerobic selenocysteine-containing dehydrogenase